MMAENGSVTSDKVQSDREKDFFLEFRSVLKLLISYHLLSLNLEEEGIFRNSRYCCNAYSHLQCLLRNTHTYTKRIILDQLKMKQFKENQITTYS
jgi:hypothetical protein